MLDQERNRKDREREGEREGKQTLHRVIDLQRVRERSSVINRPDVSERLRLMPLYFRKEEEVRVPPDSFSAAAFALIKTSYHSFFLPPANTLRDWDLFFLLPPQRWSLQNDKSCFLPWTRSLNSKWKIFILVFSKFFEIQTAFLVYVAKDQVWKAFFVYKKRYNMVRRHLFWSFFRGKPSFQRFCCWKGYF